MLELYLTGTFKKELKKAKKQGKDLKLIEEVAGLLRQQKPLPPQLRDHALTGSYKECRECHLKPDWLMIYEVSDERVILYRLGSHSELF